MKIEEILRSCAHEQVAQAAVASIGHNFSTRVREAASAYGMSVGSYTVLSLERFARHGDEGELRAVAAAMRASQEPVLAGLHRILCIMLSAGVLTGEQRRTHQRAPRIAAQVCMMEVDNRRGAYC